MQYDLLIKNGRIVDGSGMPSFRGDVAVKDGKIMETGRLNSPATQTIDADGLTVSPGIIDIHCHYDAQVLWDPLCSFSCYHGSTTVVIGNCSVALAPVKPGGRGFERTAEFLSYVEAIPMEVLRTVDVTWESIPQYMDTIDGSLGVNVGSLIGHSPLRYYVMGDECQSRPATGDELEEMRRLVHEGMSAGALGLSTNRNMRHLDAQGVKIPACWATEEEIFALGDVLGELGTGIIQSGGGQDAEVKDRFMSRLSQATGRPVLWNSLNIAARNREELMAIVDETSKAGIRAYPNCTPRLALVRFSMKNCQYFNGFPTWVPILIGSEEEMMRAYRDPEIRRKLHEEAVEGSAGVPSGMIRNWYDHMWVEEPVLEKNQGLKGKFISEIAREQGKEIMETFLDLVVEENLDTVFKTRPTVDKEGLKKTLNYPSTTLGNSDGGAHTQFQSGYGYATNILNWVREEGIMSLEQAVRRLTFEAASRFGIFDRGLLRPGMAADIMVFDPQTVKALPEDIVHDFPADGWRIREMAEGVKYTVVNGQVLIEDGKHTGALPGHVIRNSLHQTNHQ